VGRRIWCETLPLPEVAAAVELLAARALMPLVAVRPWDLIALPAVVEQCRAFDLPLGVWPMLDDAEGRWANTDDMSRFCAFAREVHALAPGAELVVDLEPPIAELRRAVTLGPLPFAREALGRARRLAEARTELVALVESVHRAGGRASAAAMPSVLFDHPVFPWTQALLGTPLDGVAFDHVSVMLYPSMMEGWSRGALDRARTRAAFAQLCRVARRRFGARAGVSVGAVGIGALGDEPVYRGPRELLEDVTTAEASGVTELSLFDLGGVLRRGGSPWLDAFATIV